VIYDQERPGHSHHHWFQNRREFHEWFAPPKNITL
jgi:hypothetical protein